MNIKKNIFFLKSASYLQPLFITGDILMAQIVPFPLDRVRKSKEANIYEEKHILYMIKNIRQNYPPSLWNTIYQLTKQGHITDSINDEVDQIADKLTSEILLDK